jgi:hypothetical protein
MKMKLGFDHACMGVTRSLRSHSPSARIAATKYYSDISNNRLNRILSESQEGREKGREHQNHEIIFYDFSIIIALIETLIGLN